MNPQKKSPVLLARIIGASSISIPYINHKKIPAVNNTNIKSDRSRTFFVFSIFIIWGIKEEVVNIPAIIPIIPI
jgi:hypothetical protein